MVVFMGINASHVKPPPAKPKDSKADSKAKPKSVATKVTAAVAIVAALSSMVTPSQAIGTLEWAADTGAGRHLVSYEAVQEQGYHSSLFSGFANDSHEKLNFSTGGGFKKSSNTIGFQDQDGILGDANHFLLDSCPMVRSIGLDVEQNFVEPLFGLRLLLPFWYRRGGYWCTAGARKRKIGARVSGQGKISAGAGSCRSMDPVGIQLGTNFAFLGTTFGQSGSSRAKNSKIGARLDPDWIPTGEK